ncbi:hypothetical protein SEA_DARDANUS_16 [Gordonia phage Dardanus]|uniref:Head-to-tail connector protein n=1 Tax=Gordonia phage Dardanus TaxID=2588489 RepID=A0A514CX08_9CAUD|nr:head closure Hc1 [Gordonia phage Dardanus]QDH85053.1 hypothetical protein SEA_DARDANUS_16 [Gordonia phage Dardanus]
MSSRTPQLTQKQWEQVAKSRAVRTAVNQRAQAIAARARGLNSAEGGSANITVDSGVRPRGRAFANVVSDRPDEEHGSETTPRRAILRRAARGG